MGGFATATTVSKDADTLMKERRFADAAIEFAKQVEKSPKDVKLRLRYAEALSYSRQWPEAIEQYQTVLELDPKNSEAKRSLGGLYRWSGDIDHSIQSYNAALEQNPKDVSAQLGLAATYRLDHDFKLATETYAQAEKQAPQDANIKQDVYNFKRDKNPRAYGYYEKGLTSTSIWGGVAVPFLSREEVGYEYQDEIRTDIYTRSDHKVGYRHYFGYNHDFEFRYRASTFNYDNPVSAFAAIDTFDEYRFAYLVPVTVNHAIRARYTFRPTTLKTTGSTFDSHKVEAELRSTWTPRFNTVLGTGWLRDLPEDAVNTSQLTENSLVVAKLEGTVGSDTQLSASYITNPDLDNSIDRTFILQAGQGINADFSWLARYKIDDYKIGDDESSLYGGLRYIPNAHLWSEFGLKYADDGTDTGIYPLASVVWKF
jgi:hypothetical protein